MSFDVECIQLRPLEITFWCLVGNGWEWGNGILINSYCGSFPHSLLSISRINHLFKREYIYEHMEIILKPINKSIIYIYISVPAQKYILSRQESRASISRAFQNVSKVRKVDSNSKSVSIAKYPQQNGKT